MSIADKAVVKNQYATSEKLAARISIHEKYSRNKQPFGEWIVSHYGLLPGERGAVEAMLGLPSSANHRFTLQNGGAQLAA